VDREGGEMETATVSKVIVSAKIENLFDECPPLIGVIPLEILDFVAHPKSQKLIGNPEHGGEQIFDMF
jgi:hypothetical protein